MPHPTARRLPLPRARCPSSALRLFWLGLFFMLSSIIFIGWLKVDWITATCMTVIVCAFQGGILWYTMFKVRMKFSFASVGVSFKKTVTAKLLVHGYDPEAETRKITAADTDGSAFNTM